MSTEPERQAQAKSSPDIFELTRKNLTTSRGLRRRRQWAYVALYSVHSMRSSLMIPHNVHGTRLAASSEHAEIIMEQDRVVSQTPGFT
jgi:hypothetical protein